MKTIYSLVILFSALLFAPTLSAIILPAPPPTLIVKDLRADEKPIQITSSTSTLAENPYFKRVKTAFVFTNPNPRTMAGELEFPLPEGAIVCGYALEINGEMIPGVVCEKEKARVAFENETRKNVDPGLVEHVKGNLWRTRIFPLQSNTPRRAEVDTLIPCAIDATAPQALLERDGEDYFLATLQDPTTRQNLEATLAHFTQGLILWDASLSTQSIAPTWRKRLEHLPEHGQWQLCLFRNRPDDLITLTTKADLLATLDTCIYDGGTDLQAALERIPPQTITLLFTDEMNTLGLTPVTIESHPGLILASRNEPPPRPITLTKLTAEQALETGLKATESTLFATVWASRRMQDLATQSDQRKDEFLALGRRYGVAGPGLSLIVLETLEQWLEYDIEPPKALSFHAEWLRQKHASDDVIAQKKAQAEHEKRLLDYWEERITWWNDPKPRKKTPKSGLFAGLFARNESHDDEAMEAEASVAYSPAYVDEDLGEDYVGESIAVRPAWAGAPAIEVDVESEAEDEGAAQPFKGPSIALQPWNPQTPYLDALKTASKEDAYKTYLKQRETYRESPAFYLDCAHWFYKNDGNACLADRIISNLAEFKLEDPVLWRTMGWRLREAGRYELAVHIFRKVLTMRPEEGQSYRDLAIVLMEDGKALMRAGDAKAAAPLLSEALTHFATATFKLHARQSGRRENDFQVAIIALEELNGLIDWINAHPWPEGHAPTLPTFDSAYRRSLPVKLRIVMSWDVDETDIDLHVLEPNGEEAYYNHRRTSEGGFVSEDVTTGYGPEEYLKKDLEKGTYKILSNYFASHQTSLTGAAIISATVYTDWGTPNEQQQILTFRLDKPKEKLLIGEVTLE